MSQRRSSIIALLLAAPLGTACSTMESPPVLLSASSSSVVLATAIVAPEAVVGVATDAVKADPGSAVAIAAAASAGAPDQAAAIRAAVIPLAPTEAERVIAVTRGQRRAPAVTRLEIPSPDRMATLVASADRAHSPRDGAPDDRTSSVYGSSGMSRLGARITRTLAGVARSVRQLVQDLR